MIIRKISRCSVWTFAVISTGVWVAGGIHSARGQTFRLSLGGQTVYGPRFGGGGTIPIQELFKSGELRFQESVLKGDVERAQRWVKPQFVDHPIKGYPPIYYAAAQGNTPMVKLLVGNRATVSRHFGGKSLAYIAASYGHNQTAETFIGLGGGRGSDISQGHSLYAANEAERRRQSAEASRAALGLVKALLTSSGGSSSYSESDRNESDKINQLQETSQRSGAGPYFGGGN